MPEASDAAREEGRCISHRSAPDSERSHFTLIRGVFTCQGMMSYLLTLTPHTATLRYSSPTSLTRESHPMEEVVSGFATCTPPSSAPVLVDDTRSTVSTFPILHSAALVSGASDHGLGMGSSGRIWKICIR